MRCVAKKVSFAKLQSPNEYRVAELRISLSNITTALSGTQTAFRPEGFDTALQTFTPEDRRCLSQNELRFKPESLRSIRPLTTRSGQNWSNYFPAQKIE